jgi:UDP-N-acetylglucosamine--N-acetylmuramyl-(pentapeptide) pyrophosphoryl-undecaprenol N-acetylglucosamine transferase
MFPAEALAAELLSRGFEVALATDQRGQTFSGALGAIPVHRLRAATLGRGMGAKIRGTVELGLGYIQARRLLGRWKPAVVVGFGGYPSLPTVVAASHLKIPVLLHEQNAVLGRANRMLLGRATKIATSFRAVRYVTDAMRGRVVITGNPVRPAIAAIRDEPYPALTSDGPLKLLVLGGSQGARVFSEVVPAAIALLPDHLRQRIQVTQQCRREDIDSARDLFENSGVAAELSSFFPDVAERLSDCHLLVARSGASTVAEIAAAGRPAILVPYPFAMDDHQTANAEALADVGGAWLVPQSGFTPECLAARLQALMTLPATLAKAADAARAWGRPDAARRLADAVLATGGFMTATANDELPFEFLGEAAE